MLALTRKLGEKIHIGQGIVLTVVEIGDGKVRLGIEAPREVPICRDVPPSEYQRRMESQKAE